MTAPALTFASRYREDADPSANGRNLDPARGEESDASLVEATLAGDSAAFDQLVYRHASMIQAIAHRVLGSAAAADDVVQETFVKAYLNLSRFRGRSSFRTWLFKIGYWCALDAYRAAKRGPRSSLEALQDGGWQAAEPGSGDQQDAHLDLEALLIKLMPEERALVTLKFLSRLTYVEMAQVTGIRPGALRVRLHRILKKLKTLWREPK